MPKGQRQRRPKGRGKPRRRTNGDVPFNRKVDIMTKSCSLPRAPRNYRFVQTSSYYMTVPIIGSSIANVAGGFPFNLASCNNSTAFQSLFDQYRIEAVDVTLRPRCNAFVATGTSSPPPLYLVIDYDNVTALASAAAATEFSTCAIVEVYQSCRRVFKPRIALAAYNSGAFTGYSNAIGWIDSAYPSVEHYGLKYFLPQCTASFTPEWDIDVKLHFQFRNVI